jgi:hypothetical protein
MQSSAAATDNFSLTAFADNMVLELTQGSRRIRVYTTAQEDTFKMEQEQQTVRLSTELMGLRQVKQLLIDSIVHGFRLTLNLLFRRGVGGVVEELAEEFRAKNPEFQSDAEEKKED